MSDGKQPMLNPAQTTLAMLLEQSRTSAEMLHLNREMLTELRRIREILDEDDGPSASVAPAPNQAPAPMPASNGAAGPAPAGFAALEKYMAKKMGIDPAALASGDHESLVMSMLEAAETKPPAAP